MDFLKKMHKKRPELELELQKKGKEKKIGTTDLITTAIVMNKGGSVCIWRIVLRILKNLGLKLFLV